MGLFIFVVCLIPGSNLPKAGWIEFLALDKWVHVLLYLTWIVVFAIGINKYHFKILISTALIMLVFGGANEFLQAFLTNGRSAEWGDFIADLLGLLIGLVLSVKFFR